MTKTRQHRASRRSFFIMKGFTPREVRYNLLAISCVNYNFCPPLTFSVQLFFEINRVLIFYRNYTWYPFAYSVLDEMLALPYIFNHFERFNRVVTQTRGNSWPPKAKRDGQKRNLLTLNLINPGNDIARRRTCRARGRILSCEPSIRQRLFAVTTLRPYVSCVGLRILHECTRIDV